MGNAAGVSKIPKDVTKCTIEQLEQMINSAIINNPWNPDYKTDEEKLHSTIRSMRKRGMRPITAEEYAAMLKRNMQTGGNLKIHLWKRLEDEEMSPKKAFGLDTSFTESEGSSGDEDGSAASSLPTTSEEAAQIFRDMASSDDKIDTSSETVAWAANLHSFEY